ncbi:hypothetical protein ABZ192_37745 [Streptomyces sp. NPDC006235]|uniref:hypothetical protein n=1 Tax=Streptomyces sp. NPDC006235 TaxID=3156736 RepID=UPI0033B02BC4
MQPVNDNACLFGPRPEESARLAEGQSLRVLRITCACAIPAGGNPVDVEAVQRNHVLTRLERLCAYPCHEQSLEAGRLQLHGWRPEVSTGNVREHRMEPSSSETL